MGVNFVCGLPGRGKNVYATRQAIRYHKKRSTKKCLKGMNALLPVDNQLQTLVFSNFPILLDKKKNIYSNYVSFFNLSTDPSVSFRYPIGSYIIIDEAQRYLDSREFKEFPKAIGTFFQHSRHGSIVEIVILTQDPSRIDVKVRQLAETFTKIDSSKFLLGFAYMKLKIYYRADDYGFPIPKKKMFGLGGPVDAMKGGYFDADEKTVLFRSKKVFNAYDSKYFRFVFDRLPLHPYRHFTNKIFTQEELTFLGIDKELSDSHLKNASTLTKGNTYGKK